MLKYFLAPDSHPQITQTPQILSSMTLWNRFKAPCANARGGLDYSNQGACTPSWVSCKSCLKEFFVFSFFRAFVISNSV